MMSGLNKTSTKLMITLVLRKMVALIMSISRKLTREVIMSPQEMSTPTILYMDSSRDSGISTLMMNLAESLKISLRKLTSA